MALQVTTVAWRPPRAILALPIKQPEIVCSELFREPLLVAIPPEHRLAGEAVLALPQLLGEKMLLLFESANFDEAVFGDPENFRIDRNPNSHLAFGFGTHFCLGNQLARLELSTMLRKVLKRLPDLRLADESALPLRPANFVSGPEAMPVVFTPTKPVLV
jgi:hypothetical protein